jgi:hypothetical protein
LHLIHFLFLSTKTILATHAFTGQHLSLERDDS